MNAVQSKRHQADYEFSATEKQKLFDVLSTIKASPFVDYPLFQKAVRDIIKSGVLPKYFTNLINKYKNRDRTKQPFIYLKNCPVDKNLPLLDWENPRASKLVLKKTFVAEAFLILYSELMGTPTLAYRFGGNGDYIRDVHASKKFQKSHTSQTLTSFGFHKELPIRDTSPDYLRIMGLRSNPKNTILTTFVKNDDLINYLDKKTLNILRQPLFYTPFTVLSVNADKTNILGNAPNYHAIITGHEISYHEKRTEGITPEAKIAIKKLNKALVNLKVGVFLGEGDFVDFANKYCLHAKDVEKVIEPEAVKQRWLIKTFNAHDIRTFEPFFVKGKYGLVNG